jgi:hypothetical protein
MFNVTDADCSGVAPLLLQILLLHADFIREFKAVYTTTSRTYTSDKKQFLKSF